MSDKTRIAIIWEDDGPARAIASPGATPTGTTGDIEEAHLFTSPDAAREEAMRRITGSYHPGSTSMIICDFEEASKLIGTTPKYHHATRLPARLTAGFGPGRLWVR